MHADPLDMVDYVRGSLSQDRADEVREHCFACRDCGDQLAAVILLRRAAPRQNQAPWYAHRSVAAAAAAVLLVGAAVWFVGFGTERSVAGSTDNHAAVAASPGAAPPPELAGRDYLEVTPSDARILGAIAFMLEAVHEPGRVVTGSGAEADRSIALLAGVGALGDARYGEAGSHLAEFASVYHPDGTLLLGLALFFEGRRMPAARQALEAHVSRLQDSDSEWGTAGRAAAYYLARLQVQAGEYAAARTLLARIVQHDGSSDGDRVQEAVNQLLLELS